MTTLFTKVTPCYTAVLAMAAVRLSQTGTVSKRMFWHRSFRQK